VCGIVGQVRADGADVDPGMLARMCAGLAHRGPDSRGIHRSAGAGLGIQRLRVIDLETGDQPLYNEDRTVAVVLNGEIYNFAELRARLQRRGHVFATKGDTEVIAHLYEEEGERCVESLRGMFAFAVWDLRRRRLLLARDRVGKKPLYYAARRGVVSFASELGALLEDDAIPREVDHRALASYLTFLYVPAPRTAFAGVSKLPPATTLVHEDGRIALRRYWALDYARKHEIADTRELHEALRDVIRRAVRRRMVADVPLGAFLSGGIDSSTVVAAMAEASPRPVKTFSIGFDHERFDELPDARRIAREFGTDHHELVVRPDAVALLPRMVRHFGEPFADSSAIPSFHLAEVTRRHVTVALNGDGGDESFAGYPRYVSNSVAARLDALPRWLRRAGQALGSRLPADANTSGALSRARRLGGTLALHPADRLARYTACFGPDARERLLTPDFAAAVTEHDPEQVVRDAWEAASGDDVLDVLLEVDVRTYLPGDLLTKIDIATMAHGLEARSPLLDDEVMQFAASIPAGLKLRGGTKKAVLRDALRGWIPDEIVDKRKQGFSVPMAEWLRGELRPVVEEVLLDPGTRARGLLDETEVRRLLDRHVERRADETPRLWALLVLETWFREVVERRPAREIDGGLAVAAV
jgi:asparagine synthase (glutamine-hydrolysing)